MINFNSLLRFVIAFCISWQLNADNLMVDEPLIYATSTIKPWGMEINGRPEGLLIETIQALQDKAGTNYQNYFRPYTRVLQEITSGYADLAITFRSPEVDQKAIHLGDIFHTKVVLMATPSMAEIESLDSLKNLRVGHIRGSKYGDNFDYATHFTRVPINSIEQGLGMLIRGRIDVMAAVDHTVYWGKHNLGLTPNDLIEIFKIPGPTLSLYMSKESSGKDTILSYKAIIEELKKSGKFEEIYGNPKRWLSHKSQSLKQEEL